VGLVLFCALGFVALYRLAGLPTAPAEMESILSMSPSAVAEAVTRSSDIRMASNAVEVPQSTSLSRPVNQHVDNAHGGSVSLQSGSVSVGSSGVVTVGSGIVSSGSSGSVVVSSGVSTTGSSGCVQLSSGSSSFGGSGGVTLPAKASAASVAVDVTGNWCATGKELLSDGSIASSSATVDAQLVLTLPAEVPSGIRMGAADPPMPPSTVEWPQPAPSTDTHPVPPVHSPPPVPALTEPISGFNLAWKAGILTACLISALLSIRYGRVGFFSFLTAAGVAGGLAATQSPSMTLLVSPAPEAQGPGCLPIFSVPLEATPTVPKAEEPAVAPEPAPAAVTTLLSTTARKPLVRRDSASYAAATDTSLRVPVTWEGSRPRHAEDPTLDNAAGWGPAEAAEGRTAEGRTLFLAHRPSTVPSKLSRVITARSTSSEGKGGGGEHTEGPAPRLTTTGGSREAVAAARMAAVKKEVTVVFKGADGEVLGASSPEATA